MTARQVSFHLAALEEAEAAALWYRERSPRAAQRFVAEIVKVVEEIIAAPQRWPKAPANTRRVRLPCFPFIVIYRESSDIIQILAIAHGRRRPGYWKSRS